MELETVLIKGTGDSIFLRINKVDFDESIHQLFEENPPEPQPEPKTRRKKEEPTSLLES